MEIYLLYECSPYDGSQVIAVFDDKIIAECVAEKLRLELAKYRDEYYGWAKVCDSIDNVEDWPDMPDPNLGDPDATIQIVVRAINTADAKYYSGVQDIIGSVLDRVDGAKKAYLRAYHHAHAHGDGEKDALEDAEAAYARHLMRVE